MNAQWINLFYLVAAILFIVALKMLTSPRTARRGNGIASVGMLLAIIGTLLAGGVVDYIWIIIGLIVGAAIGAFAAMSVPMTAMPQMVSFFNGSGGLAAALVAVSQIVSRSGGGGMPAAESVEAGVSCLIGSITFTGSMIACGKLQEIISGRPVVFPIQKPLNVLLFAIAIAFVILLGIFPHHGWLLWPVLALAAGLGVLIVLPIGGADMPVVIAMLNSLTGLAAAATGFLLGNVGLIISGALVGASGGILTVLMTQAMNRSLANVLFGAVGLASTESVEKKTVRRYDIQDAKIVLEDASKVIVIPGYGLAVARAQHVVKDLAGILEKRSCEVRYAVHPVAGRMPGHMNVLLAEADIPYDQILDLDQSNTELESADVALVIGANDVVNPVAHEDPKSPIWGMPILEAQKARTVIIIKRSLAPGFAGIDNPLFYRESTMMLFGDAREVLTELVSTMKP